MPFDTQHVTVPQKSTETILLVIFFGLAWFGLALVLVFVKIQNAPAKPVPMVPRIPQTDLEYLQLHFTL